MQLRFVLFILYCCKIHISYFRIKFDIFNVRAFRGDKTLEKYAFFIRWNSRMANIFPYLYKKENDYLINICSKKYTFSISVETHDV